jgi:AcrR family transcriptional regulator
MFFWGIPKDQLTKALRMNIHSGVVKSGDKADLILDAALELFVERGFHGTAVPLVAERAKVSTGTIYHYFESKEALVNALYRKWKSETGRRLVEDFPVDQPIRLQFHTIWKRMAEFALKHRREFAFLELHHHGSYLDSESQAMEAQLMSFGRVMIERAQQAKAFKELDANLLIEFTIGAFIGVFRAATEGRLPMTMETFMQCEQLCWEAVRA